MQEVDRDLAQFLTGRTNLPYGGVAYVSATCSEIAYSVSGYTLGSFYSTTEPGFGNWDIVVSARMNLATTAAPITPMTTGSTTALVATSTVVRS